MSIKPKLKRNIANELEIPDEIEPLEIIVPEVEFNESNPEKDVIKDYQFARKKYMTFIATGEAILKHEMGNYRIDRSARLIEAISLLIKTVGDQTDKLIQLQEKLKKIRPNDNSVEENENAVNLNDIVKMINEKNSSN